MEMKRHIRVTGFTLIELLVVVSIIVLLIGLLLTTLGKARHNARSAVCMSNQRNVSDDIASFQANSNGRFPWLTTGGKWLHTDVLACPADDNPVMMPREAMNTAADVPMSYGFNPEFALYKVPIERVKDPSKRVTLYDGLGGLPGGNSNAYDGSSGTIGGDYFIDGNKVTITHLPPGNIGNPQVSSISLNALDAHVGHNHPDSTHVDLIGNWMIGGRIDVPTYTRGDFVRRHPVGPHIGNVAFADGHGASYVALDPTWYQFPN